MSTASFLVVASLVVLHRLGSGDLAGPPSAPADWPVWVDAVGPATAVVACLRVMGIVLGWYLLAVTSLWWLSTSSLRARALVVRLVPRVLRRMVGGAAGVTLAATAVAVAAVPVGPQTVASALLQPAEDPPPDPGDVDPSPTTSPPESPNTGQSEPPGPGRSAPPQRPTARLERFRFEPRPIDLPLRSAPQRVPYERWSVRCGDHFWAIAQEVLIEAGWVHPTPFEIERYWRTLVRHNAERLVDPANPDLILPGQQFELPPVDGPGPERVSGR